MPTLQKCSTKKALTLGLSKQGVSYRTTNDRCSNRCGSRINKCFLQCCLIENILENVVAHQGMVVWKQWPTFLNGGTSVAVSRLVLWSWDATTPESKRLWPNSQVQWEAGGKGTQGRLSVHIPNCRVQSVAKLNTPIRATFQEIIVADWFGYRELTAHRPGTT